MEAAGVKELHLRDYTARHGIPDPAYTRTVATPLADALYVDNWTARTGMELIRNTPRDVPWYLQVNFSGPHEPLDMTEAMAQTMAGRDAFSVPAGGPLTREQHRQIRAAYTALVENLDAQVGEFIEWLRHRGELEQTVIIYSSDHGEMLGERGRWAKSVPFQSSVGIPLLIAGPGVKGGRVNASPVSLIDIGATVLELAQLPPPATTAARSLYPILSGEATRVRSHVFSGLAGWRMVDDGRHKLIRGHDPLSTGYGHGSDPQAPLLLFDRMRDPGEENNLAAVLPEKVSELNVFLQSIANH